MAIIEFSINVSNAIEVAALFDRIEVWRAATISGTYSEITAMEDTAAFVDGSVAGSWTLSGKSLTAHLNNADPISFSFTGSDPFNLETALVQINAVFPALASEVPTDTNRIRLSSSITGTQSSIDLAGTSLSVLGLPTTHINGQSARPLISANTETYLFRDYDGDANFWYKTRYVNTSTSAVSAFCDPFSGGPGTALSGSFVVTGKIALSDLTGAPIVGRRIILVPTGPQVIADGMGNNYGVLPSVDRITAVTDNSGKASITLVKGQRLKVFLEGTTFQREFVVPNIDFDILTVATTQPDPLSIVVSPPFPIRVS